MPAPRATPKKTPARPASTPTTGNFTKFLGPGLLLVALIFLVYANTHHVPLIFDDVPSIEKNESIKHLATVFSPPRGGETVTARPLLNATFALNQALTGTSLTGYHVTNILIHAFAALTLWLVLRKTLALPVFGKRFTLSGNLLAWLAAALWALHPLQTESVTYTVQRAESLVGLFYFLTLYAFIRSNAPGAKHIWPIATWSFCLAGMASKEVMVTAPVILLLYDQTFLSGSFGESFKKNGRLLAALASTWLLLGYLIATNGARGNTVGFAGDLTWWNYFFTQGYAVTRYLLLSVLPLSLTFDYGILIIKDLPTIICCGLFVIILLLLTVLLLVRRPREGFLGAWFFIILAPTSSVVPVLTQTIAEHRTYLPLAAITSTIAFAIWRINPRYHVAILASLILVSGTITWQRNQAYQTSESIWADTIAKRPKNARALNNLGTIYCTQNRFTEAITIFNEVLSAYPNDSESNYNMGFVLARLSRDAEAINYYRTAIQSNPNNTDALANCGAALQRLGRYKESIAQNEAALRLAPNIAQAHNNLGLALLQGGHTDEALIHLRKSTELSPTDSGYLKILVTVLTETGHDTEAINVFETFLARTPNADFFTYLGVLYARNGQLEKARDAFQSAVQLDPDHIEANANLARANAQLKTKPQQ